VSRSCHSLRDLVRQCGGCASQLGHDVASFNSGVYWPAVRGIGPHLAPSCIQIVVVQLACDATNHMHGNRSHFDGHQRIPLPPLRCVYSLIHNLDIAIAKARCDYLAGRAGPKQQFISTLVQQPLGFARPAEGDHRLTVSL